MDSKFVLGFIVLGFIVISGCTQPSSSGTGEGKILSGNGETQQSPAEELIVGEFTMDRTNNGYSPRTMTIKKGSTVTFQNTSNGPHWPATAMHPTHLNYPESDIQKCGTAEEQSIFDACKGFEPGESYSFTFNEVGKWAFHDHLNSSNFGKIIVAE